MTWKNTWNLSNQSSHIPQAAEIGLMKTETTFVNADTTSALLLPAELHAGTSFCWSPVDHHDFPWAEGSGRVEQLADKPGIPSGKHALRGCCNHGPVRKKKSQTLLEIYIAKKMKSPRALLTWCQDTSLMTAISVLARDTKRWVTLPLPCPYPCSTAFLSQPFFLVCTFGCKVKQDLKSQKVTRERRPATVLTF